MDESKYAATQSPTRITITRFMESPVPTMYRRFLSLGGPNPYSGVSASKGFKLYKSDSNPHHRKHTQLSVGQRERTRNVKRTDGERSMDAWRPTRVRAQTDRGDSPN